MRIVWTINWFLDYRVPVFKELLKLCDGNFFLIYSIENVPERVHRKIQDELGSNAIGLRGEKKYEFKISKSDGDFANQKIRFTMQPGLTKKIQDLKPDVIIGEGFFRWGIFNIIAKIKLGCKYIMLYERTEHTERNLSFPIRMARKILLPYMNHIITSGSLCKKYIESLSYNSNKISSGHMVADVHQLQKKMMQPSQDNKFFNYDIKRIVFIGQLVERKGVIPLLQAWNQITPNSWELIVVGNGPLKKEVEKYANTNDSITFLGQIDHDEIHVIYKASNFFIMPTLEDNWSLVVPEAMSCSLPIATSIYNGCHPEYVSEKNGFVFDPLNPKDFEKVLEEIIALDENRLEEMGNHSKKLISKYTPASAAVSIYNAAKKILN